MATSAKRDLRKLSQAEKQRRALELRKSGESYDVIAKKLGLTNRSGAWKLVKAAIQKVIQEPAEEVRLIELERLDTLLLGVWSKAKMGDAPSVDRALRIMERRASYLGLDAPKTMHFDLSKLTDEQLHQIVEGGSGAPAIVGGSGASTTDTPAATSDSQGPR